MLLQESTADDGDEESDRSKSEVNDQDDEESAEVMELIVWIQLTMRFFMFSHMLQLIKKKLRRLLFYFNFNCVFEYLAFQC